MEKPDNCDHLAVWQEVSPFLCHVNMGQFSLVPIPFFCTITSKTEMFRFAKMNGGGMTKPAEAVASIWPNSVEKMQPVRKFYPFFLLRCKRKP